MLCIKCKASIPDDALYCPYCGKKQATGEKRKYKKRPNGAGTVVKLKGNLKCPWRASMRGVVIGYYPTQKEGYEAIARLVDTDITERYNWTFKQVFEAWKPLHYPDVGKSTRENYDRAYEISAELHDRKFRALRSDDFQRILDAHSDKAQSTVEKYKQLFTQLSDWAKDNDIINKNYAKSAEARGREAKPHIPLTDQEIEKIEQDGSETARVVCMMLATGVRISELFELPLADYHETYIVGGEKTESGRERIIPIRPEGRVHFAYFAEKARERGAELLIGGYSGNKKANNFRKRDYYDLLDRLGIDRAKTPHSTRTTYGTRAATDEGLSPAVLQKVMGHSGFDTTQKYYNKPDAEKLVKAVEQGASKSKETA